MTVNDRKWLWKFFNDTKHRVAYLQQLSFLWNFPEGVQILCDEE